MAQHKCCFSLCFTIHCPTPHLLRNTQNTQSLKDITWVFIFSSPSSVMLLVQRRRHNSSSCLIFLSQFSCYACSVRWILSSSLSLSSRVPSHWRGNCISTDTGWNEFCWFMKYKVSYMKKKKKSNRLWEISYHTMDLVLFCSSHYPVSKVMMMGVVPQCV